MIGAKIVKWFSANQRDLPWRRTHDPYAIWISEVMLQQTQVATVVPYWERWMRELPTIRALAEAQPDRVLKLWEGLGYYSRARNLQKAAQLICEKFAREFPRNFEDILSLPGVGRYTAGAIASIAFNEAAPLVDGNVARVFSRCFGIYGDPKSKKTSEELWARAAALVRGVRDRSAFNQGVMELGATVCRVSSPACGECPLRGECFALKNGAVEKLPEAAARPKVETRYFRARLFRRNGAVLLRKRPVGVVNSGFWEMPNDEVKNGLKNGVICRVKHSITRYRMTLEVVEGKGVVLGGTWMEIEELARLPMVNAHRKAFVALGLMGGSKNDPAKIPMETGKTCAMLGHQM